MDKNNFIELGKEIYRLTVLFPTREPLRYRLREISDEILSQFIAKKNDYYANLQLQLEIIDSYLEIALAQNWVALDCIAEIKNKYLQAARDLAEEQKKIVPPIIEMHAAQSEFNPKLNAPQIEIEKLPETMAVNSDVVAAQEDEEEIGLGLTASQISRQNRILAFLKEKGGAQVWEIQKIFPSVSKRTIRRDFRSMLKQGVIERTGERNTTAYKLKINIS